MSAKEYLAIHDFLEGQCGIRLGSGKEYLVSSRLGRLLREYQLSSYAELVARLQGFAGRQLQTAVIDAMTTNETFWFRDPAHFRILTETILPAHKQTGLRVWSAAASTGQEAYNIAMAIGEARRAGKLPAGCRQEIIGTDICTGALEQAKEGRYCGLAAGRGMTEEQKRRFFRVDGDCLEVAPDYRTGVNFREYNLTKPFDALGRFDVVFCRNVLIYFSAERKADIIQRIGRVLNPGGYLFLGSTESLNGHAELFEMVNQHGGLAYRRREAP
jgi:chemotaxis protein methyltransferase CheR